MLENILDISIIDLLFITGMAIDRHLSLKEPIVLMRIIESLLVYLDITSVEQAKITLKKKHVFFIRSISSGIIL